MWDSRPEVLRQILKPIKACGGDDSPEEIEIGLQWAFKQEIFSQIIMLAVAPIKRDRINPSNGGAASFDEKFGPE